MTGNNNIKADEFTSEKFLKEQNVQVSDTTGDE